MNTRVSAATLAHRLSLLTCLSLLLLFGASSALAQVDVTASAGTPAASYTTLKGAFDAINAGTHQDIIGIGISGDTTETAPAVLNASGTGSSSYTSILINPTGGAARSISGAIIAGSPLIDFSGADNVTIDGLNSGGNSLTIANTTVSATSGTATLRFIGGATGNTITNANIQGSGTMSVATNGATIFFSTDAVTTAGNDNNTISNNNIGPAGANLPTKAILGNGSTSTTAIGNSGIVITNNNIFDYFGAAVTSAGVATNGGCNTWSITGNRFYQTGTRTWTTGALHNAINIGNTTATSGAQGFTITGNIVGFASNSQTGTYTLTGSTGKFIGIVFNGITGGTLSSVNTNTIAAVSLTGVTSSGTSTSSPFTGILVTNGLADTNSNLIGSQGATGSLAFSTTTTSGTETYGIFNFSLDSWTANNNNIGGISITNLGASGNFLFFGLRANTSTAKIFSAASNNVGGTVANSIQLTSTGTGSQVLGMATSNAGSTWTLNTVRNLTNNNGTGTTTTASLIGMLSTTTTPSHTLAQNTIFGLSNTSAAAATVVTGIQFTGGTANLVARNLIYGLTTASTSTAAEVNGIRVAGGTTVYRNNMIAVGAGIANAIGTGSTTGGVNGINEPLGTDSFFHNSVYVGGAPTAGVGPSYAFNSSQTVNTRSFRDNAFVNARSNSGATGKNYLVRVGGTAPNPTGLTIDNNIYFANGTGAVFGFFNSLDVASLGAWKTAVGQDAGSFAVDPQFLAPAAATPDLHIHPTNPTVAEGNGFDVGVTDDFDGQTRASFSPTDIGADAGNFNGVDLAPPTITYSQFGNTSLTTDRTLGATLTDVSGVATGGVAPRIYYRKNAGAYFSQACSLTSGTVLNGTWDCIIANADMGGVAVADVVGYFVVAQDSAGNLGSNPAGAIGADVNTIGTPPTANTYTIVAAYSGPIAVGSGETFTSLTNPGGIFEALNAGVLSGDLVLDLTSDLLAETGTHALNQWAEDGVGGYSLLLKPNGAPRTISGSNAGALIRLNGADRVLFDGSTTATLVAPEHLVGGNPALRELTIQNTNTGTSAVVIAIQSGAAGAQNNTLRNLNVLGQAPTTTLAGIALGGASPGTAGTDNDNNRIENCTVRRVIYGIYSAGQNAANPNTGTVITQNDLSATAADRVRRVGIVVFNEDGVQITENSVGGLDTNESADAVAIGVGAQGLDNTTVTTGGITNALVSRNRIDGVISASATGFSAAGIALAGAPGGANTVVNNMISGVTSPATSPDLVAGIFIAGVGGSSTRVYDNSVSMSGDRGVVASQTPSYALAITGTNPAVELKGNAFATTQIASGGGVNAKSYAIGMVSTTFTNLDSNYNDFFASGANAGFFRSGSLGAAAGTDYATLGAWAAAISGDANSLEVDPLFVSASDLHLAAASPLAGAGTPISGVSVDFDNEPRSLTAPTLGADELTADIAITKTVDNAAPGLGTNVVFTVTASNNGSSDANGVTVSDLLPNGLALVTAVPSTGSYNNATGLWTIGTLANGGSATLIVTATVNRIETLVNTASKSGQNEIDPNGSNNTATVSLNGAALIDIEVTETVDLGTPGIGQDVFFLVTARNAGPATANLVVLEDNLPAGLTFVTSTPSQGSYTAGTGTWDVGTLASGASATLSVQMTNTVNTPVIRTVTKIAATEDDFITGNDAASVVLNPATPNADLALSKITSQEPVSSGLDFNYVVVVTNLGAGNATGVVMTDDLPAGVTLVTATPSQGSCSGTTTVTCTLGNLLVGGSATIDIVVTKNDPGSVTNTASVAGNEADPNPDNNSNMAITTPVELMTFSVE